MQLNSGEYLGADLVTDVALPISDRLSVNLDLGLYDDQYVSGASAWFVSYGGVARSKPVDAVELTGFYGRYDCGDEEQAPAIYGQDWADWAGHSQNYGGNIKASLGSWQVTAGAFNNRLTKDDRQY